MADSPEVVNIHAAKTHLSRLVARVEAGEEILIARDGRPAAKLVPLPRTPAPQPYPAAPSEGHAESREVPAPYGAAPGAPPVVIDWLPAIVGRLVRLADPVRIVLFGSRASGHARADSDYDVLIVLDRVEERRARRIELRASLADLPIALDIVVAEARELDPAREGPRGVVQWAADTGRVVYERG